MISADRERWEEADACFRSAFAGAERAGDIHLQGLCLLNHTEVHLARQQHDRARTEVERALDIFDQFESRIDKVDAYRVLGTVHRVTGRLEAAEGHLLQACARKSHPNRLTAGEFEHQAAQDWCRVCGLAGLARAYDRAGVPDSAIASYERSITTPFITRMIEDYVELPGAFKHLGQLYEARGEREKARHYYSRFVELWKESDPELRPQVAEARRRMRSLGGDSGH
jgi:tetratricopeptide (TPR) repeat protein